jgi:hypothetical protein
MKKNCKGGHTLVTILMWYIPLCYYNNDNINKSPSNTTSILNCIHLYYIVYTLVTLPRTVTPYRDSVDGTRDRVTYQSWLRGNVTGMFGALSVFVRRIKGMIRLRPEQFWTCNVTRYHRPLLSPSLHS